MNDHKPVPGKFDRMDKGLEGLQMITEGCRRILHAEKTGPILTGSNLHALALEILNKATGPDFSPFAKQMAKESPQNGCSEASFESRIKPVKSSIIRILCPEIHMPFELTAQGEALFQAGSDHEQHQSPDGKTH